MGITDINEIRNQFKNKKSDILFQALKNSMNIVQRGGYDLRRITEVVSGKEFGRKETKKVYSPKVRTTSRDVGSTINKYRDSWSKNHADFGKDKKINMPDYYAVISQNLECIFETEGGELSKGGKLTSNIRPEVAQNLSSSQLQMLDKNIATVIDKIKLIDNHIQNPNGFSYDLVKSYLNELHYTTSKCRDIYSGAINSDKYLENKEESSKKETYEGDNWAGQKKDITLAFRQMGWDVNIKEGTAKQIDGVNIEGVVAFDQSQVQQFIENYNALSDKDKRAFTIQGLFDVYLVRVKDVVKEWTKNDAPDKRQEYLAKINQQSGAFNVSSKEWQVLALSEGSEFEYNKQMMSLLILSRDYGKSNVKASENVLKYKDVSAWDKLVATFPEENEVKTKIEEIRSKYINLIIDEVNASTNKVINKESAIYKAYSEIVKLEDENMPQIEIEDVISRQVYDVMSKSNNLPSGVTSYSDWLKLNGVEIPETTTTTTTENTTASDVTYSKEDIVKILENDDNKAFVEQWMEDNDFAGDVNNPNEKLNDAVKKILTDVSKNPENKGKSVEELWQASIGEIEAENAALVKEAVESFNSIDYQMNGDLCKFGIFHTTVDNFIAELNELKFDSLEQKSKAIDEMIQKAREKDSVSDPAFYQEMKECVLRGGCTGNAYYNGLIKEAEDDVNIQKYDKFINAVSKGIANGVTLEGTPLTEEENAEAQEMIENWQKACDSKDKVKMTNEIAKNGLKDPVKGESALLAEFDKLNINKEKIKKSTLGDQVQFDAQGLAKKLKPFNVKAGQKYLQGLIDAIKKVVIMEKESLESAETGNGIRGIDNDGGNAGGGNGTNGTNQIDAEKQKELEIKEDAAFYLMGEAFNQSLNDNLQALGIPRGELMNFQNGGQLSPNTLKNLENQNLTPADVMNVINRQNNMTNLFDRMAFGESTDKDFTFVNGNNVIQCDKIGYLKQAFYAKASNTQYVVDKNELAMILIKGEENSLDFDGKRTALDTDETYALRIMQRRPDIATIINTLDSISNEEAYALVGIASTSDGKDGYFGGKIDEETLTKLTNAKTPEERKSIIKKDININQIMDPRAAELDLAIAQSRARFREKLKKNALNKVKELLKVNPSLDKVTQQNAVIEYLNSKDAIDILSFEAGITVRGDLNEAANGVMEDTQASMIHRVKNDCFAEIEKGVTVEEQTKEESIEVKEDEVVTPAQPEAAVEQSETKEEQPKFEEQVVTPSAPVELNYDAVVDKLIEKGFDLSVLNMQTADKFPEALKQQKRVKLRNEIQYLHVNDYKGLIPDNLTEDILNTIIDKFEERVRESQTETPAEETKLEPLTEEDVIFDKFLFYGKDLNNNEYMKVILNAINDVREHNGDYESFKRQIMGNRKLPQKLPQEDLKALVDDRDFQSDIEKYLPVKSAQKVEEQPVKDYQKIVDALKANGFVFDINAGPYHIQVGSELTNNMDKYREVFTTQLTSDDMKAIANLYSNQVSHEQQTEISKEESYKIIIKALQSNNFEFDGNFEHNEQLKRELMKEDYVNLRGILKDFVVHDLDVIAMQYDDGMNM